MGQAVSVKRVSDSLTPIRAHLNPTMVDKLKNNLTIFDQAKSLLHKALLIIQYPLNLVEYKTLITESSGITPILRHPQNSNPTS